MRTKLFVTLFFDKMKFILLFIVLVSASGYFILKQVDGLMIEPRQVEIPDIEIIGGWGNEDTDAEAEEMRVSIKELAEQLEEISDQGTEIYSMIARDLYTFTSPFYNVTFRIYGSEKNFFERFEGQLAYGTLPHEGKREVLVGNNAASYYHLNVGDVINEKVELDIGTGNEEYIVSGIMEEDDRYFGNGFYLLKENFHSFREIPEDNMVMIYASGKQTYKKIAGSLDKLNAEKAFGTYVDNFKVKASEKNKFAVNIAYASIGSLLVLELVYLYISKGLEKKVGIIKALGIPDSRVLIICCLGFAVLVILTSTIVLIISLIMFDIKMGFLCLLLLAIGTLTFLILFTQIAVMYKKIEPSASMPAK